MVNRKKRLQRGIESLNKQINLHDEKKSLALEAGQIELEGYYGKELNKLKKIKDHKKKLLDR